MGISQSWCIKCTLGSVQKAYTQIFCSSCDHKMGTILSADQAGWYFSFAAPEDDLHMEHRPLKRYEIPASKLVLELGYSVDYEDEKENFEPDEADTVELINGERMPWEQAKRDGIDYIALYYVNEKGKPVQILDAELA